MARTTTFLRIKNSQYWEEIDKMIKEGYSIAYVAKWLKEKPEFVDLPEQRIRDALYSYRRNLAPIEVAKYKIPKVFLDKWKQIEKDINELRELRKLYEIQKDRINIDYRTEKKIGKLFATTHREISTAAEILRELIGLKQGLGIIPKDLGKITVESDVVASLENISRKVGLSLERLASDAEFRRKVLDLLNLLEKNNNDV